MSGSVNLAIVQGNLGRDPEIRNTQAGGKIQTPAGASINFPNPDLIFADCFYGGSGGGVIWCPGSGMNNGQYWSGFYEQVHGTRVHCVGGAGVDTSLIPFGPGNGFIPGDKPNILRDGGWFI